MNAHLETGDTERVLLLLWKVGVRIMPKLRNRYRGCQ